MMYNSKTTLIILLTALIWTGFPDFFCRTTLSSSVYARSLRCSVCNSKIRNGQSYIKSDNKIICSDSCFKKLLPKCVVCSKQSQKGFNKDGKFYCSKACLSTTFPKCALCHKPSSRMIQVGGSSGQMYCPTCASKPRCFCCNAPDADMETLPDERKLCSKCSKTAIMDIKEAKKVMAEVRALMKKELNLSTNDDIILRVVSFPTLKKRSPNYSHGTEMGLYINEQEFEKIKSRKFSFGKGVTESEKVNKVGEKHYIYILYGLNRDKFIEVLAHELGHDWMQANYPTVKDLKLKEGWAELVAYLVNAKYKNHYLNKRIEENTDPIYGGGFKLIHEEFRKNGNKGLEQLFLHN